MRRILTSSYYFFTWLLTLLSVLLLGLFGCRFFFDCFSTFFYILYIIWMDVFFFPFNPKNESNQKIFYFFSLSTSSNGASQRIKKILSKSWFYKLYFSGQLKSRWCLEFSLSNCWFLVFVIVGTCKRLQLQERRIIEKKNIHKTHVRISFGPLIFFRKNTFPLCWLSSLTSLL